MNANAIFEEELSRRGFSFVREDQDTYRVHLERWEVTANLANVRRNAERDQDPDAMNGVLRSSRRARPATDLAERADCSG